MSRSGQIGQNDEQNFRRRFYVLLYSRVAVITALLGSTIFFNLRSDESLLATSQLVLYSLVAVVYLGTTGTLAWLRFWRLNLNLHVQAQIVFDVLLATCLVYLTGGVESPFTFFYALPIIITAVFFHRRGTFLTAGLSCLMLAAVFILENQGIIPLGLDGRLGSPPSGGRVVYLLALNFTVFFVIAWLSGTLGEQLRRTGKKLEETESDLLDLTALNRDIVQSLLSGLLVIDKEDRVSLMNPVAGEILGIDVDEARGKLATRVFPELSSALTQVSGDRSLRSELEHSIGDKEIVVPVGVTLSILRNAEGEDAGTLVHMQDLTERRRMEVSMKKAEKMAALGQFAAGMAHEIRNPLASVSGAAQILKGNEDIEDESRRLLGIIQRETKRLDSLLSDFLAYARPRDPRLKACKLGELCRDTLSVFARSRNHDNLEIESDIAIVRARVDPDQIRQVLWNLLANAGEALDRGGKVKIELAEPEGDAGHDTVVLRVIDDGPTIDPALRPRIFDPFFTTKKGGSGLGLAMVSRIIEAHGGSVTLECPPEGGNRFLVYIPGVVDE